MVNQKTKLDALAIALLIVLCASWGGLQVAIKLALPTIPPILQAAIRSIGATALVFLWMAWKRQPILKNDGSLWLGIVAGLLFAAEFLFIYLGLEYTNASRAVLFIYMSPFIVAIGSHWWVPNEYITRTQVFGLVCAFLGLVLAFKESLGLPNEMVVVGDLMMFLGAVLCGATTVLIKATKLIDVSPSKILFYLLGVSSIALIITSLSIENIGTTSLSSIGVASLLYQTVWVAFITYLLWYWLVRHYPPSRLASFTFLSPLFGVIAGSVLLNESISNILIFSLLLVGVGIYFVNRSPMVISQES